MSGDAAPAPRAHNEHDIANTAAAVAVHVCVADRTLAHDIASALQELVIPAPDALTLFEDGPTDWRVESYYPANIDIAALQVQLDALVPNVRARLQAEFVPDANWVALSQAALPPVVAPPFTIYGSHDADRIARGPNAILIDAGEAFGTAHHPTTYGCLKAIGRLTSLRKFQNCFDLGCGSGVLAIALARKLPSARILASDLDHQSVVVAAENMALNGVASRIKARVAGGTDAPDVRCRQPFDLIVANILAGPLITLAPAMRRVAASHATLVLSGILIPQAPQVIAAYRAQGFVMLRHDRINGWSTLTLRRSQTRRGR